MCMCVRWGVHGPFSSAGRQDCARRRVVSLARSNCAVAQGRGALGHHDGQMRSTRARASLTHTHTITRSRSRTYTRTRVSATRAGNAIEQSRMFGRHFDHTDQLVSKISRESINALKAHFADEMGKEDWRLVSYCCWLAPARAQQGAASASAGRASVVAAGRLTRNLCLVLHACELACVWGVQRRSHEPVCHHSHCCCRPLPVQVVKLKKVFGVQ